MKTHKITLTLSFIIFTISLLSACGQESTPTSDIPIQPTAATSVPPTSVAAIDTTVLPTPTNKTVSSEPVATTGVTTDGVPPTPTKAFTTIAIANITSVTYPTVAPTMNITPIVLPTFTPDSKVSIAPGEPDAEERNFLELLNTFRKSKNSQPLTFDPHLFQSARWMAQDMATKSYINHTDSLGRPVATRIQAFGFGSKWVGENIAGGLEHAAENLSIWQSDDIHLNNMANPYWSKAGVGRYYFQTGFNRWVWVLDMG